MEDELVQYFVINSELNMSPGKIATQVAHVATMIPYHLDISEIDTWHNWLISDQPKIVLKGKEKDLVKLIDKGAIHIRDLGRTEIPPNSLTCVGFPPRPKSQMKKLVGRLRLL